MITERRPSNSALLLSVLMLLATWAGSPLLASDAPTKPKLWERIKTATNQSLERRQGQQPRSASGLYASPQHDGALFEVISPAIGGRFEGLFAQDDHTQAQLGRLQWPRAAITFTEFGANLPCWTVRARIWSSAKASRDETFRICAAPVQITDDLGNAATMKEANLFHLNRRLQGVRTMSMAHTGTERTQGPNPPLQPWFFRLTDDPSGRRDIGDQLMAILPRLAWVSGYATDADLHLDGRGIATGFQDPRLWFAGFDPAGNRDQAEVQP